MIIFLTRRVRKSSFHCIVLLLLSAGSSPSKEPLRTCSCCGWWGLAALYEGPDFHSGMGWLWTLQDIRWSIDDLSIAKSFLVKQAKFGVRGSAASRFAKTKSEAIASGTATPVVGTVSRHCSRICAMVLQAWLVMAYLMYAYSTKGDGHPRFMRNSMYYNSMI